MKTGRSQGTGGPQSLSVPPGRAPELEDPLNRHFFHPLARRLAVALVPLGISPNAVSVAGGLCIVAAALAYVGLDWPTSVILGLSLHLMWHIFDGADGDLARLTGRTSPLGELVDGVCDYAGHAFLYFALAIALDDVLGIWAWVLGVLAALSRVIQSNYAESQRRNYLWRVYGVPWLRHTSSSGSLEEQRGLFVRLFGGFAKGYIALAQASSPISDRIDTAISRFPDGSPQRAEAQALCRRYGGELLPLLSWIGQNPRTIILGISMAAGSAAYFLVVEFTLLNIVLVCAMARERRCSATLAAQLEQIGAPKAD